MYQEVCFNRGTEVGGGGELMWATRSAPPPPQSFSACYGPVYKTTIQIIILKSAQETSTRHIAFEAGKLYFTIGDFTFPYTTKQLCRVNSELGKPVGRQAFFSAKPKTF